MSSWSWYPVTLLSLAFEGIQQEVRSHVGLASPVDISHICTKAWEGFAQIAEVRTTSTATFCVLAAALVTLGLWKPPGKLTFWLPEATPGSRGGVEVSTGESKLVLAQRGPPISREKVCTGGCRGTVASQEKDSLSRVSFGVWHSSTSIRAVSRSEPNPS